MIENNYDTYKDFELIELFCENNRLSYEPYYSGRGMFGRDCVGFVSDNPLVDYGNLAIFMQENDRDLSTPTMDSMGKDSVIIYWRSLQDTRVYDENDNVIGYNRLELEKADSRSENEQ